MLIVQRKRWDIAARACIVGRKRKARKGASLPPLEDSSHLTAGWPGLTSGLIVLQVLCEGSSPMKHRCIPLVVWERAGFWSGWGGEGHIWPLQVSTSVTPLLPGIMRCNSVILLLCVVRPKNKLIFGTSPTLNRKTAKCFLSGAEHRFGRIS